MVEIVPFEPRYASHFRDLNYEWIEHYFEIEEVDRVVLENPQREIIDKGGKIFIAILDNTPVGACALIKRDNGYELSKMAVTEAAQGKKIGLKLGKAIIEKAREIGSNRVFLETHSSLIPAINLYVKLGFKETCEASGSGYERCNKQMELLL